MLPVHAPSSLGSSVTLLERDEGHNDLHMQGSVTGYLYEWRGLWTWCEKASCGRDISLSHPFSLLPA